MWLSLHRPIVSAAYEPLPRVSNRAFGKHNAFAKSSIPPTKQRFIPASGTYPKDFVIGSANVGINPSVTDRDDLMLVASRTPSNGAAVFTKNAVPASSIIVSRELLRKTGGRGLRGIIANAGCANVWTGNAGLQDTTIMGRDAGKYVSGERAGTPSEDLSTLVMHTGAGGVRLPIDQIVDTIPALCESMGSDHSHWYEAARALLTTDTFPKMLSRTFTLPSFPGTTFAIAGITKGAGMIHPNMATTLAVICTDAPISALALQQLLSVAADKSYNCISIEGDTSTNDMVAMLANGAAVAETSSASVKEIDYSPLDASQSSDFVSMQEMLISFMASLAKLVVRDGEGATKFITIRVRNCPSYLAAQHVASRIARSVLLKTAVYGSQAQCWGNVLAALGYAVIDLPDSVQKELKSGEMVLIPELTSIRLVKNPVDAEYDEPRGEEEVLTFFSCGAPVKVPENEAEEVMKRDDIEFVVDLRDDGREKSGEFEEAVYWTCDITHDFVTINGDFPK